MKSNNRSMLGVAAAVVLALVGGLLLWQNSDSGESEAVEPAVEQTQVVVAKRDIPAGESASQISEDAFAFIELVSVPRNEVKLGALTSVANLADLATGRNVVVAAIPGGAQLTTADFVVPGQQALSALPDVDPNLFEITVALEPQRALGGNLRPGMNVAIVGSFDSGPDVVGREPTTVVVTESTLVTDIKTEELFSQEQLSNDPLAPSLAPSSRLFVTFGVTVEDLEKITYAVEFGRVWLSRQHDEATIDGSELTVINNEAVSLDPNARSNDLLVDPFNPDPVLALVDDGSEDDGEG